MLGSPLASAAADLLCDPYRLYQVLRKHRLAQSMASTFHGAIDAQVAIPAPQCGPGGTMNFNFGSGRTDSTLPLDLIARLPPG
jgi:hypothetical protein